MTEEGAAVELALSVTTCHMTVRVDQERNAGTVTGQRVFMKHD